MKFKLNDAEYNIKFRHVRRGDEIHPNDLHGGELMKLIKKNRRNAVTSARLFEDVGNGPYEIAFGVAECSRSDQFVKSCGREIALRDMAHYMIEETAFNDQGCIRDTGKLLIGIADAFADRERVEREALLQQEEDKDEKAICVLTDCECQANAEAL